MHVYLLLQFYWLLYVVIDVLLLVVVHVSQPESTALCISTSILQGYVTTTQFRLRLAGSFLSHNRKLTQDLISCYQISKPI